MVVIVIILLFKYSDINKDIDVQDAVTSEQVPHASAIKKEASDLQIKAISEYNHNDYERHQTCGFDEKIFHESLEDINYQSISKIELNRIENTITDCKKWFDRLTNISDSELGQIKLKIKEKNQILEGLSNISFDENKIIKATSLIRHEDPDIFGTALLYLLTYDNRFITKIGEEIGTSDISFLRANIDLSLLYSCQNGLDCSVKSSLMQDMCILDEGACNLSFNSWLRQTKTINQYDDFIVSLSIINSIINSGWFEEREILNPTDP